eukprot:gene19982-25952_t
MFVQRQELIARTKFKGVIRKSCVSDSSIGLVLIRLEYINTLTNDSFNQIVISDESSDIRVPITVYRPVWWPQLDINTGKPPI